MGDSRFLKSSTRDLTSSEKSPEKDTGDSTGPEKDTSEDSENSPEGSSAAADEGEGVVAHDFARLAAGT